MPEVNQPEENQESYKTVSNDVAQFLSLVGGHNFSSDDIDRQYNIQSRDAKRYRWQILEDMVNKGILQKLQTKKYRKVEQQLEEMEWFNANPEDTIPMFLPLELHQYVKIYHKSINIVAGSPGAGKTGFLYDLMLRNMESTGRDLTLFTNDMTAEEIKERMMNSDFYIPYPPPFKVYDRADNFGDVILPDGVNVIDYLDLSSEVYLIGDEIEKIYRKLNRGCAWIGIQKKPGQDIGIGGIYSSKRAKLYLSLDSIKENGEYLHKLTVHKARGRVDSKINPRTLDIKFKLINGIKFIKTV